MPLVIRSYEPGDAPACAAVYHRSWNAGHPYAPRTIDEEAFRTAMSARAVFVAQSDDGTILGFAGLYAAEGFLHHLYVDPSAFRQGVGRALLDHVVQSADRPVSLKCQTRNHAAMAFYRAQGWTPGEIGEEEGIGQWQRFHSPALPQPHRTTDEALP